ncbi:hypothetical protein Bbelb_334110 [Branchiostoma belcheri]|nr:hypothetical protein Bbelb_334110 [Branchiostoma belcheri]
MKVHPDGPIRAQCASPDAKLSCKCHEEVVVELKCPLTYKDTAPNANILSYLYESPDGVKLKQSSAAHQILGNMFATELLTGKLKAQIDGEDASQVAGTSQSSSREDASQVADTSQPSSSEDASQVADTSQPSSSVDASQVADTSQPSSSNGHSSQTASAQAPVICPTCAKPCLDDFKRFGDGSEGCDVCDRLYHFKCVGL